MEITIDKDFAEKCPDFKLGILLMKVKTKTEYPELLQVIKERSDEIADQIKTEDISKIPSIAAARKGYKAVGKDPARYRLSAEALFRRTVNGKGLYQINNVVDALNLVSLQNGISIGGYDFQKINGKIALGIGLEQEPYEGIGRGNLNIQYLPVLRDETGAFGSPTSDSKRTMITESTEDFLMVFMGFGGLDTLQTDMEYAVSLMERFAEGVVLEMK